MLSQKIEFVNCVVNEVHIYNNAESTKSESKKTNLQKFTEKKQKTLKKQGEYPSIVEKLEKIGKKGRANRMKECSTIIEYNQCSCGHQEILRVNSCRDKLCPICQWRLSLKRYADMVQITNQAIKQNNQMRWSFITLTVKNCNDLDDTIKKMSYAWSKLTKRTFFKQNITGWARSLEITYNANTKQYHPHFHIIACGNNKFSHEDLFNLWCMSNAELIVNPKLSQNAQDIVLASANTQKQLLGSILETFKYSTKSKDIEEMPLKQFRHFVSAVNGKRFLAFGGILKTIKQNLKLNLEELEQEKTTDEEKEVHCKSCGSNELQKCLAKWSFDTNTYNKIELEEHRKEQAK